ncbi:hypothetical protein BOTBODRAFT_278366 [Botryobasidium botryosum FD-172 SS1]|uniref:Uncharacterized protein n=1 Tax=Botryobasidium botryosum (strain FD-172 SS1) TaxID=930990 RepID=A0A067MWQ7_BOTB1|nr:hypothetical protein BOTBODRAFT_278366 [Botryobasidium botryosum FD-172 SS1]
MKDMARSIKKLTQAVASCQEVTTKSLKDFAKLLNLHRGRSGSDSGSDEEIKLPDVKVPSGKIKHRDPIRTALQRSVRVHVMDLLNHPRGLPTPPGDETLSGFRNGLNAGCEIDNFMVDLRDKPACPWNQSAMVVFATDFLASHEIPPTRQNRYQVERAFYTWTRGQHLKYQKHVQTPHLKEQFRKRAGRDQRKRALWHRRIAATTRHPALLPHLAIVKRLNVNGMSSDESELEEGTARKRYYIITPGWRHPSLINFLRALDLVYMLTRINDLGNVGKGNLPHERIPTDSIRPAPGIHGGENATGAVKGLPWNCYNPDWLEQLDEGQIYSLAIQEDEEYDFRHEDRLVELLHGGQAD